MTTRKYNVRKNNTNHNKVAFHQTHIDERNNTNYPLSVVNSLENISKEAASLLYYQKMPVEYFLNNPHIRGILIAHETGTGKSIEAIAIAEGLSAAGRRPIVFAPKALQNNFKGNVELYANLTGKKTSEYTYISANANNVIDQIAKAALGQNLEEILNVGDELDPVAILEGTVVIIDEAHNFFNGIVSGSKNALKLYDIFNSVRDLRLIMLTSNVLINTPFELVPCFNLASGTALLPEDFEQFCDLFVDDATHKMKNIEHFKARIFGLCSYYGSWFQFGGKLDIHSSVISPNKPVRLPFIEERIAMSPNQYGAYRVARRKEVATASGKKKKAGFLQKPGSSGSTYRVRSRQYSNFWLEETSSTVEVERRFEGKEISEAVKMLDVHSPKFKKILDNIEKHNNQHGLIYSAFVENFGIKWFAEALKIRGWKEYRKGDRSAVKRFAFLTGQLDTDDRSEMIDTFNSVENKNAEIIHLILGSPAMEEGIDTKRIRHVHIMEPPWHYSAIEQIIARAVRYKSHDDLPENERNVQPYIYISVDAADKGIIKNTEQSTDESMYILAIEKKLINDQFFKAIIESSIDCNIHIKDATDIAKKMINCMRCMPTNKPLFDVDIHKQIKSPLNCVQATDKKIKVSEIEYAGEKFYYSTNPLKIFSNDNKVGAFVEMLPNHKMYTPLFKMLIDKI